MDRNGMEIKLFIEGLELHNECLDAGLLECIRRAEIYFLANGSCFLQKVVD